ncbi:uncharacterized protein LOC127032921 [Gopherus flavomarginatus]|uniref:uncharacterized protein LOC127032921 n=1 Tax=Gopherus flavomarginatus TaxID=286002 RepID=UPI0021CC0EE4|nr:uncharacterized protein LOC127032921 [Gopherus flavomarginatus]
MADEAGKSQALVKAELSVSKAKDVRKETELRMKSYANWEEFLMPAPISIAILGQLVFISAGQGDFSINKNPPKDGFKHIKYPESFRACLCQVSNQGWAAFNTAHVNMDQIRLLSKSVPGRMKVIVKILFQDMETVNAMLPMHLKNMKAVADDCKDLAHAVEDKYSDVIYLIQELMEACLNAKKGYEDELKDIQIALQQAEIKEKVAKEAQKLAEQYHKQVKQLVYESFNQYNEAMKAIPTGWNAVGMTIVENITNGFSNIFTGFTGMFTKIANKIIPGKMEGSAVAGPEEFDHGSMVAALNIFTKSGMLLTYTTQLKELINEHDGLNMKKIVNEKTQEVNTNWLKDSFLYTKSSIDTENKCGPKNQAQEICTSGLRICEQLEKMALSKNKGKEEEKSLVEEINRLYQKASEFDSHSKSSVGSPAFAPKPPNMAKCQQGSMGGSSALQSAHLKVEQSREMLKSIQDEYQRSFENFKRQNDELMEIMCAMEKCKVQDVDFDRARKMLIKGLKALGRMKEPWEKMVRFFQMISSLIDSCLSRDIKEFVSSVSDVQKIENYSSKSFVIDTIYTQAFNASNVAHLVHMISETYTEVSNNYLMDRVSSLGRLIAMEPSDPGFHSEREVLQKGCEEARQAIYDMVKEKKEEFDRSVEARVETIDRELKAVLPPLSVEEQKAIEGAVKQGMKELTAEEEDLFE